MDTRYSLAHHIYHNRSAGLGSDIVEQNGLAGVPSDAYPDINVSREAAARGTIAKSSGGPFAVTMQTNTSIVFWPEDCDDISD